MAFKIPKKHKKHDLIVLIKDGPRTNNYDVYSFEKKTHLKDILKKIGFD